MQGAVSRHSFARCDGGIYVGIEGPAFSTRAESNWYRTRGDSVSGMTNLPAAGLAREAEIADVTLALATDWDCWHPHPACLTAQIAIANLPANAKNAQLCSGGLNQPFA